MPEECLRLDGLLKTGFILLADAPDKELVLGLVGRFWSLSGEVQHLDKDEFRRFNKRGYAKATWNFSLEPLGANATRLTTETRVCCLDEASRRRFRLYWLFISPFSAWVRKKALRIIKSESERRH